MGTDNRSGWRLFLLALWCLVAASGCGGEGGMASSGDAASAEVAGSGSGGTGGRGDGSGGASVGADVAPASGGAGGAASDGDAAGPEDAPRLDGGQAGADRGQSGAGGGRACNGLPAGVQPPFMPVYRIPLRLHRTRSDLGDDQLCRILEEVNEIWWKQAGVCFEIEAVKTEAAATTGFDFWFERSTPFPNGVTANGVFGGAHQVYGLDRPGLSAAPNPVRELAARTCAHELGHGLNLGHQNPGESCLLSGTQCDDLLMRSGHRGYKVVSGSPANVDELSRARARARTLSLPPSDATICGPPRILP